MKWPLIILTAWAGFTIALICWTHHLDRTPNRMPAPPEPGDLGYEEARAMLDGGPIWLPGDADILDGRRLP